MNGAVRRRLVAVLLAVLMAASAVDAMPLGCSSGTPSIARSHSCCPDDAATMPAPAACCAMSEGQAPRGPIEVRVTAPAPPLLSVPPACNDLFARLSSARASSTPVSTSAPPIYLQHLSLLI